jgi:hypothetical protein
MMEMADKLKEEVRENFEGIRGYRLEIPRLLKRRASESMSPPARRRRID